MNSLVISPASRSISLKLTDKALSDSLAADQTAVSVVRVTFSDSLIDCEQVQVDSIILADSTNLKVDTIVWVDSTRPKCLIHR